MRLRPSPTRAASLYDPRFCHVPHGEGTIQRRAVGDATRISRFDTPWESARSGLGGLKGLRSLLKVCER
jgi:hypothetical protein